MAADSGNRSNRMLMIVSAAAASILTVMVVTAVAMMAVEEAETMHVNESGDRSLPMSAGDASTDAILILDPQGRDADILMPTKVSRPGCENTDSCYVPSVHTATAGRPITWINEDSAFHSVTSGKYDKPGDTFDSGFMDPYDLYTLSFMVPGTYNYYCTLHPWMEGVIVITPDE